VTAAPGRAGKVVATVRGRLSGSGRGHADARLPGRPPSIGTHERVPALIAYEGPVLMRVPS